MVAAENSPGRCREDELILACVRFFINSGQCVDGEILAGQGLDWPCFVRATQRHGVIACVYQTLKQLGPGTVPSEVMMELHAEYQKNSFRNLLLTKNLLEVESLFRAHDIEVAPFKGPTLAMSAYGDLYARVCSDLDILVARRQVPKAIDLLQGQGFVPLLRLNSEQLRNYMNAINDMQFTHHKSGICIELHWELTNGFTVLPMTFEFLRSSMGNRQIVMSSMLQFGTEDMLVYLCVHGMKHLWERLEWVCCIAGTIQSHADLDWQRVIQRAEQIQCRRILNLGLALADHLFRVQLPKVVRDGVLEDHRVQEMVCRVERTLFPLGDSQKKIQGGYSFARLQFMARDTRGEQVAYGLRQVFRPQIADWQWVALPAGWSFLYILVRPVRLVWKLLYRSLSTKMI